MFKKKAGLISILLTIFMMVISGCGGSGHTQVPTGNTPTTSSNSNPLTALSISQGSVQLMKNGVGNWATMQVGSTLQAGDIIRTGDSSGATITFFDGSTIELKAGTQIEISSLVGGTTGPTTILLKQQIGETISTVTKIMDPASRYEIETPAAVAAVRGSMMGVRVDSLGRTVVTNLEGHITVTALGTEVSIPVGMQVAVNKGEAPGQPQTATTSPPTSTLPPATTVPPPTTVSGTPNIAGTWSVLTTVIQANGVCTSETGLTRTYTIQISQNDRAVTITAPYSPGNILVGEIIPPKSSSNTTINWMLVISGTLPDKGGTDTLLYRLEIINDSTMSGSIDWTWTNGTEICPDGKSSAVVSR